MNPKYANLFQPFTLNNGVEVQNRFAVAPMPHFGSNADGTPERADQYGIPDILRSLCKQGGAWLPPVKGQQDWQPVDI